MVLLGEVATFLGVSLDSYSAGKKITSVTADSRLVNHESIFVCLTGEHFDGHSFIPQALKAGAAMIVINVDRDIRSSVPIVKVADTRETLGDLASLVAGNPSRELDLIGVTGTNGKTTTTHFIRSILQTSGYESELIGTIGYTRGDTTHRLAHTTPEAPVIQHILQQYFQEGVQSCAMEVSSHAIAMNRIQGCTFRAGVFTNITDREHLDFHGDFEEYRRVKLSFFQNYIASQPDSLACINLDDHSADSFVEAAGSQVITYSLQSSKGAQVWASEMKTDLFGVTFTLHLPGDISEKIRIQLPGPYNVANALAATAVTAALGIDPTKIFEGLSSLKTVAGRFESIREGQDFAVVVDYAHSADALENLLHGARACQPAELITVFGCGGDRDKTKRSRMGDIANRLSDHVIITNDNPRSEDPEEIIGQILSGISDTSACTTILDRGEAIKEAIMTARSGDMVVIAGKGHEDYQLFAGKSVHFDDREEVRKALKLRLHS